MTDSHQLLNTLKQEMRRHGIRYCDVAAHLHLSEASIKRLFANKDMSVKRLEQVCQLVGWSLLDAAKAAEHDAHKLERLTMPQEKEIASDPLLLMLTVSVINGYTYDDLIEQFDLSAAECIQVLAKLDNLALIELLPGNRIKLKISPNFSWHPRGPIQQFFLKHIVQPFFSSDFAEKNEQLIVKNALLSDSQNQEIQILLNKVAEKFNHYTRDNNTQDIKYKKGATLILALRDWRFPVFEKYFS